jgi:HSP20 family protein
MGVTGSGYPLNVKEVSTMATKKQDQSGTEKGTEMQSTGGRGGQQTGMTQRGGGSFMPSFFGSNPYDMMRMSPFALMRRFTEDMDRMFGEFGGGGLQQSGQSGMGGAFMPQVEMFEREGELVVRADLPGIDKDDINIQVTDEGLLLEGERRSENEENRGGVYRSERSYGSFRRFIRLPEDVDTENAQATFRNGVLEITMQAPERQSRRRQIEIQGEGSRRESTEDQTQTKAAGTRS